MTRSDKLPGPTPIVEDLRGPDHLVPFALVEWKREWFSEHAIQYDWRPAICVRVIGRDHRAEEARGTAELFVFPDGAHDGEVVTVRIDDMDRGNQTGEWRWPS